MTIIRNAVAAARRALNKLRAAEPAWLATKRKPIAGFVSTSLTAWLARHGHAVTTTQAIELAGAVGSVVTYLIPNRRAAGG